MKKKISIIAIIVAVILLFFTAFSYATDIETITSENNETEVVETENEETEYEIIEDDFYLIEESDYEMDKLVDGNAYLLVDGNVNFSGSVKGAVYIIANGTVEFTEESYIADAIYIVANSVKISGEVYDIYSASENFELLEDGYVSRDIRAIASNIKLLGTIYRDVHLNAENIEVEDESTKLLIVGDFNYSSTNEIEGLQEVVQYGEINFSKQEEVEEEVQTTQDTIEEYIVSALSSLVYVFVIYLLLKLISPKFIEKTGTDLKEKGIVAFMVGLLSWVIITLALFASLILLFTSFGSPAAIIIWITLLVVIYMSPAMFTIAILDIVKQKMEKVKKNMGLEILALAIIALCVWILQQLPYIGGFVSAIVVTTGIGLIIRNVRAKIEAKIETKIETVIESEITTETQTEATENTETKGEDTNTPEQ